MPIISNFPAGGKVALAAKQDKLIGRPGQIDGFDQDGSAVPQDLAEAFAATDEEVAEMLNEVFGSKKATNK